MLRNDCKLCRSGQHKFFCGECECCGMPQICSDCKHKKNRFCREWNVPLHMLKTDFCKKKVKIL